MIDVASNGKSKFLADAPSEIADVLEWYDARGVRGEPAPNLTDFAEKFLGAMIEDHALIPVVTVSALETLALTLLHHQRNPANPGAWLNLGLALRRMALYRVDDVPEINQKRLQAAIESFKRSLELEPENTGKNIRAWVGQALTYHLMGLYEDEVKCCLQALDSDRSDPSLWLFYAFALGAAGRKVKALSVIDDAYRAYVDAGEPEALRHIFADVKQGSSIDALRKRVF